MIPTRDDKIAAKLTRMMGIPLSSEEYERGDDLGIDGGGLMPAAKKPLPPLTDESGTVRTDRVICHLLNALGIEVPHSEDETEWKCALMTACMQKINQLTGKGGKSGAGLNPNPLVAAVQQGGSLNNQGKPEPMYMSLEVPPEQAEAVRALLRGMNISVH